MAVTIPVASANKNVPYPDGGVLNIGKCTVGSPGSTGYDVDLSGEVATTALFTVAANTIVYDVLAKVKTAFTAGAALTIGDSDDVDGYMTVTELVSTVISSEFRSSKASTALAAVYQFGKLYAATQTIDVTSGATFAVGQMDVYLVYSRA